MHKYCFFWNESQMQCGCWFDDIYKIQSRKYAKKSDSKRAKKTMQRENGQSLSSCTFENDSIASQGSPVSDKPGGKTQADRRSATGSQSLYARVLF